LTGGIGAALSMIGEQRGGLQPIIIGGFGWFCCCHLLDSPNAMAGITGARSQITPLNPQDLHVYIMIVYEHDRQAKYV